MFGIEPRKNEIIDRAIAILEQKTPEKIGTQRRIAANVDALETFQEMLDDINLYGCIPSIGANSPPKLTMHNVEISVRPEIILRSQGKTGPLVGALKLHFSSSYPLSEDSSGYLSAVLQEWCKIHMSDLGNAYGPHCFVIDVGAGKQRAGVKATAQRLRDIEAACQNIAALWPTIEPGTDF